MHQKLYWDSAARRRLRYIYSDTQIYIYYIHIQIYHVYYGQTSKPTGASLRQRFKQLLLSKMQLDSRVETASIELFDWQTTCIAFRSRLRPSLFRCWQGKAVYRIIYRLQCDQPTPLLQNFNNILTFEFKQKRRSEKCYSSLHIVHSFFAMVMIML